MPRPTRCLPEGGRVPAALACLLLLAAGALAPGVLAHHDPLARVPSLRALKVDAPLRVDGVLDEPFWERCEVGTGLIDQRTQQPALEQTLIRVAYTRTHIYVAVECLDTNVAALRATERREDRAFTGDDWVEVHFDPPHNHRGKYAFFANPLGTRADANEGPSGVFNYGWSAEWDCAARVHADRWTFEMRIPLKVMNFFRKDGQPWGFNITRLQRRTDVTSFWSFSATDIYKPRHFGHLTGLDLAEAAFDRNWEVSPYVSVRTDFDGDTDTFFKEGLDVSVRLTPTITTAWALNPDFGQVESDDDTIELRDTERFLPEKRPFFREGEQLIRMPYSLYYSRRFSAIEAAMKTSGLFRGGSFTFMNLQGDVAHDGRFHGNSSVLRVLQDVRERSSLGYYFADSELDQGHARVGSVDGYIFLDDTWRCRFQAAASAELLHDPRQQWDKDRLDLLGSSSIIYGRYPWDMTFSYDVLTEQFNPLLGYVPRRNLHGPSMAASFLQRSGQAWYKSWDLYYNPAIYQNLQGATALRDHYAHAGLVFANDLGVGLGYADQYHLPYHNRRVQAEVNLFSSDYWRAVNVAAASGVFENTPYQEITLGKRYKPWERLPIRHEFTIRREDRPDRTERVRWLNRVILDVYLGQDMWLKASLQHRDNGIRNLSLIYGWKLSRHVQWYMVFNHIHDGGDNGNSIFTKVVYTF